MNIEDNILEILPNVSKPARYIGSEWNMEKKDPVGKIRVVLCFPDTYEIGMSYLGFKIMYHLLNSYDDVYCERVFAPWIDCEKALVEKKIPLFSLETRTPLDQFDIIAFSINYELTYTNVLNILSLGRLPVKRLDRDGTHPVIIAGGPSTLNPAPLTKFIDAFFVGEGENGVEKIINAARAHLKGDKNKNKFLEAINKIGSVYVPGAEKEVQKSILKDLNSSFYPVKQIVPFIEVVHDRVSLEIMRGCPNRCRFCQASVVYHPLRIRKIDRILEIAKSAYSNCGYDEISLLSLSSGEHPQIIEILKTLLNEFREKRVSISLPSLKAENLVKDFPPLLKQIKKTGLTLALESGSERLRSVLNKQIDLDNLLDIITFAFNSGWKHLKLYLMIGLPTETESDIVKTVDFIGKIAIIAKGKGYVSLSISSFVPKPFTPFQWEGMLDNEELLKRKELLFSGLKKFKNVEFKFHDTKIAFLEAVFSRADSKLADAIELAWKDGAKFDAWSECFKYDIWANAFKKLDLSMEYFANRKIQHHEVLPWDFINIGIDKKHLVEEAKACGL